MRALVLCLAAGCGGNSTTPAPDASADSPIADSPVAPLVLPCTASDQVLLAARLPGSLFSDLVAQDGTSLYALGGTGGGAITRIPKSGGSPTILAQGFASSFAQVNSMAIGVDAKGVYFASAGFPVGPGYVGRVPVEGGAISMLAPNRLINFYGNLTVANGTVYWTEDNDHLTGAIGSVSTSGGLVTRIGAGGDVPRRVAVGGGFVWWATEGRIPKRFGSVLMRAPASGGAPEMVLPQVLPYSLETNSFAVVYGSGPGLAVLPFGASTPTTMLDPSVGAGLVALDETDAYVLQEDLTRLSRLLRVPLDGSSAVTVVSSTTSEITGAVVDDTCIYWADDEKGIVTRRK